MHIHTYPKENYKVTYEIPNLKKVYIFDYYVSVWHNVCKTEFDENHGKKQR
jgi:hypothetical protein